eukprot:CAMPEP_0118933390 /NCGR_PEP_ID=MMETSP1169-20130426/11961_1 /TAXON_ID=36882 /ORGANISM="Pyramimonas obovata, Strain CCMP722" /LENGTH=385 /DNA_ID=CAMNT_0006876145 /DNA_START=299 /DNA_END=1454 /DNA_ORIENTATION=-
MQPPAAGTKRNADDAGVLANNNNTNNGQRASQVSAEESLAGMTSGEGKGGGRSSKKPRLVWTTELHQRFLNAVNHLGVKSAVPKTILQLMNVEGMTRENVASHLQKYRLYLKRIQGLPPNAQLPDDRRPNTTYGAFPGGTAARPPGAVAHAPPGPPGAARVGGAVMGGQPAVPPGVGAPPGAAVGTVGYPGAQLPVSQSLVQPPDLRVTAAAAAASMGLPGSGAAGALYRPQVPQGGYTFPGYGGLPASTIAAAAANFGHQPQVMPPSSATAEAAAAAAAMLTAATYQRMSAPPPGIPGMMPQAQQGMQGLPGGMMVPGLAVGGVAGSLQPDHRWWPGAAVSSGLMSAGGPPWLRDEPTWPATAAAGLADLTKAEPKQLGMSTAG